jgi:hypothetical protein
MAEAYQGGSPNARFLAGSLPQSETSWKSFLLRSSWSVVIHVGGLALLIWILTRPATIAGLAKVIDQPDITWIAQPGPGGRGTGAGTPPLRRSGQCRVGSQRPAAGGAQCTPPSPTPRAASPRGALA